jgi:hypothetical protein
MDLIKKTSLQNTEQETKDTLNWKLEQLTAKNLPIESGLADYIAFGMEGIENDIAQLSNYKALIESQIKQAKANQAKVKVECAEWLAGQGLDKINGLNVSSITITNAVEAKTEEKIKEINYFYEGYQYSSVSLINQLLNQSQIEEIEIPETKIIPAKPAQIKVNKKRK